MPVVKTIDGVEFEIDEIDLPLLNGLRLDCTTSGYIRYYKPVSKFGANDAKRGFLHKLILNLGFGEEGDHKDGNPLNNKRKNLRKATTQQNRFNRAQRKSKWPRGIQQKSNGQFTARIGINNYHMYIGMFINLPDACAAYNRKAVEFHGEFAVLSSATDTKAGREWLALNKKEINFATSRSD